jgi:hypothetical protein
MGEEKIIIRGDTATLKAANGKAIAMSVHALLQQAAPRRIDSCGMRLPREVRFAYSRGDFLILVCEYPAGPYTVSWIADDSPAPYGSEATYQNVTISLPYVVVLAAFQRDYLSSVNECFFRRAPLAEIDEENELLYPGLLNCSRFMPPDGRPLSWICTQKLDRTPIHREPDSRKRIVVGLEALRRCLFEQGFNMSSDYHEFSSWYTESRRVDERIGTVKRWHDETIKDRFMGLDIAWLKVDANLKAVIERMFQNNGVHAGGICNSRQLARLMINNTK